MSFLIDLLLSPGLVVGTCLGVIVALALHWLFPAASPVLGAMAVAVGFVLGLLFPWFERRGRS